MELGRRIFYWRTKAGLTQQGLADKVGVSDAAVSMWESEKATPGTVNLAAIADACGVSLAKFWGTLPAAKASA